MIYSQLFLYIYGYHSHYSLTFRMLGPNDEGKAILAVVLTPFMLWFFRYVMISGYTRKTGLKLMMLSLAAMSLTLGGAYTFAAILGSMVLIGVVFRRDPKMFFLGAWGGIFPLTYASIYAFLLLK